jgi:hypothetical protein
MTRAYRTVSSPVLEVEAFSLPDRQILSKATAEITSNPHHTTLTVLGTSWNRGGPGHIVLVTAIPGGESETEGSVNAG